MYFFFLLHFVLLLPKDMLLVMKNQSESRTCHLPTVRGRTPACVRIHGQDSPQHEIFVLSHQSAVFQDGSHVVGVKLLIALGARDIDA